MSARDRVPLTGRSNISTARQSARSQPRSARPEVGSGRIGNAGVTSMTSPIKISTRSSGADSARSSSISINESLTRLRETKKREEFEKDQEAIRSLGDYNAFSRPRPSIGQPLRSVFLDPSINNLPLSRTRSELMKRLRATSVPHPSYDIDGDGWVSQEDYRLAKRFDFDGNGVLDPEERQVAKTVLADEFFRRNADKLYVYGDKVAENSHKQNVNSLAHAYSFERSYNSLKQIERSVQATKSKEIRECMALNDDTLTKHNFFTNKFDTTAWNDYDAIPRAASTYGLTDHAGSRKRLMFSRREAARVIGENKMAIAESDKPKVNTRRSNMITNVSVENN